MYFWEMVVMARKLAIAGLSALASSGLQLVWGCFVLWISLVATLQNQPFEVDLVHKMEVLSLVALVIAILIGFHFLLNDADHLWATILLILINGTVALLLFTYKLIIIII